MQITGRCFYLVMRKKHITIEQVDNKLKFIKPPKKKLYNQRAGVLFTICVFQNKSCGLMYHFASLA